MYEIDKAVPGENMPPLHPNCRSTTIAYFGEENLKGIERRAVDPETGKDYKIPADMSYEKWYKEKVIDKYGQDQAEVMKKKIINKASDKKQHERYLKILGDEVPEPLDDFKEMKYNDIDKWKYVKLDYKRQVELIGNPSLKLPNADKVFIADEKFTGYLFNEANKKGYAKGKNFTERLGYNATNYEMLKDEIIRRAPKYPSMAKLIDEYGTRYEQKIIIYGLNNKPANVIVAWNVKVDVTKMTSTYIKEVK